MLLLLTPRSVPVSVDEAVEDVGDYKPELNIDVLGRVALIE
jgi:hypothetical protein